MVQFCQQNYITPTAPTRSPLCYLPNVCIVDNSSLQINLAMGLCFLVLFIAKHDFVGLIGQP